MELNTFLDQSFFEISSAWVQLNWLFIPKLEGKGKGVKGKAILLNEFNFDYFGYSDMINNNYLKFSIF